MTRDVIYLGPAPANESCAQIGDSNYPEASKAECLAYIRAIKRVCGDPPEGAILRVKSEAHDYGTYREVTVEFDGNDPVAAAYAHRCDAHAPTTWAEASMEPPVKRTRGR